MFRIAMTLLLLLPGLGTGGAGRAAPIAFDVTALGFRVGAFTIDARMTGARYSVVARFRTTGLVRLFREMGFEMRASGRRRGAAFLPESYAEEVNTGSRVSSARMRYAGGVPRLVAGQVGDGEVAPLDPAGQGGTLDPLTALLIVLRDQPDADLCRADLQIFDGGRRTRVVLTGRSERDGLVTCAGQFRRIAGYPQRELETRRVVPLTVTYARGEDGLMRAQSALLRTTYGPVGLRRRN